MDMFISALIAEGIPALLLRLAITASGQKGAARLTTALSSLGPGGMIGGLITLGVVQAASFVITEEVIERIYICAIHQMLKEGASQDEVISNINSYKISSGLRDRLRREAMAYSVN